MDAETTSKKLTALIEKHDEIRMAVAWAYNGPLAQLLLTKSSKYRCIVFGLNGFITRPDFVDALVGKKRAFVAQQAQGLFHPKIYFFQSDNSVDVVIGSSNFTNGGLRTNVEANLLLCGNATESVFEQIKQKISQYAEQAVPISLQLAKSYRSEYDAAYKPKITNAALPGKTMRARPSGSLLSKMNWIEFYKAVSAEDREKLAARTALLSKVQSWFTRSASMSGLEPSEWKAIAGVIGDKEKADAGLSDVDWGLFGSMGRAVNFTSLIGKRNKALAKAIDVIPRQGFVSKADFEEFRILFSNAFNGSKGKNGIASATRLLAMKRPDCFVCVDGKNKAGLARALDCNVSELRLQSYWEQVIEPLRDSRWYNIRRSATGAGAEVWDYRVAMLDGIYYED